MSKRGRPKKEGGKDTNLTVRVPQQYHEKLEELVAAAVELDLAASRSAVAREALSIGLKSLRRKLLRERAKRSATPTCPLCKGRTPRRGFPPS